MRRLGMSLLFRRRRLVELIVAIAILSLIAVTINSASTPTTRRTLLGGQKAYEQLRKTADLRAKCRRYIHLTEMDEPVSLNRVLDFEFDNLVFKEDRYKRVKIKEYKTDKKFTSQEEREAQADIDFKKDLEDVYFFSQELEFHTHNLKVWGKCIIEHNYGSLKCSLFQKKEYPWMSGDWPIVESYNGTVLQEARPECLLNNLKASGVGIVIPIVPSISKDREVDSVQRLILLLRKQGNQLPIQVVHYGLLTVYDKKQLTKVARGDGLQEEPLQDVSFIDVRATVKNLLQNAVFSSSTFVHSLSALFNTFEDAIIMTSKMIPFIDNFDILLQSPQYKLSGILNFRIPSKLSYKPAKFTPGFHEIEKIIQARLMPGEFEHEYFGIEEKVGVDFKRFFDDDFERIIDPTLMIVNKRAASGVLIALNLQLYKKFLEPRLGTTVDDDLGIIGEYMWIGQAISGRNNVHWQDAVIAGIRTPQNNVEHKRVTTAMEVCSLSWGQMLDGDLLYITAHQLEAARDDGTSFFDVLEAKFALREKKLVTSGDPSKDTDPSNNKFEDVIDNTIVDELRSNPMKIDVVIEPPNLLKEAYSPGAREPKVGWLMQEFDNLNDHQYWCGYNFAGDPSAGERGRTWPISKESQEKYAKWVSSWYSYTRY